jgi:hypothetical protein
VKKGPNLWERAIKGYTNRCDERCKNCFELNFRRNKRQLNLILSF